MIPRNPSSLMASQMLQSDKDIPGLKLLIATLYLNAAFGLRSIFYAWGVPLPLRLVSQGYGVAMMTLLIIGVASYLNWPGRVTRLFTLAFRLKIYCWLVLTLVLAFYGVARGNDYILIGKESVLFISIALYALVLGDDRIVGPVMRHLTIIFYAALPFVLLYYDTPPVIVDDGGTYSDVNMEISYRFSDTLGYNIRYLLTPCILLGAHALVTKTTSEGWRAAQFSSLLIYFAIEIGLFKFRGALVGFGVLITSFVLMRSLVERRIHLKTILILLIALAPLALWYTQTNSWIELQERFSGARTEETTFESRFNEAATCFSELGLESLIGRGMGGTFDNSAVMALPAATKWPTLHFGILVFSLKGGIALMLCYIAFLVPGFYRRSREWYQNAYNVMALILLPLLVFNSLFNPWSLTHDSIIVYVSVGFIIARLGLNGQPSQVLKR